MDHRKNYILNKLRNSENLFIPDLAIELDISERTLKNEIKTLNLLLGKFLIDIQNDKTIIIDSELFDKLSNDLINNTNLATYRLNKKERTILELLNLSFANKYVTVDELCNVLKVSRGTILADLKMLKKELRRKSIKIIAFTNHGFMIKGNEDNIKMYLLDILFDKDYQLNPFLRKEVEYILYDSVNIDALSFKLLEYVESKEIEMTDDLFYKALVLIIITLKRIKVRKNGISDYLNKKTLLYDCLQEYDSSLVLSKSENDKFEIALNELFSINTTVSIDVNNADEQMKVSSFIWKVCQDFDIIALFGYENYHNLFSHIELTIQYLAKKKNISPNPFCQELRNKYSEIFKSIEQNVYIIRDLVDREINENDISYMAMHIASVIEGRKPNKPSLSAVIVCPNGRCTSLLLRARILKYFNITIKEILPSYKVNDELDVDFVISTVPLKIDSIPIIQINQMLSQIDIDNMEQQINRMISTKKERFILNDIQSYLDEYQAISLSYPDDFDMELNELNQKYDPVDNSDLLYFYKGLKEEFINLDSKVTTWEASIKEAGKLLLEHDYLTQNYIDEMVELVKENGPYIVFSPGFVIAHAGPNDGAKKLGVSVVRSKNPIDFGIEDINVKFVICLSIPDKVNHVFLLFQIYKCMCNTKIFNYLSQAINKREFIQILKIFELRSND